MENTHDNAQSFFKAEIEKWRDDPSIHFDHPACMVAYASACSAPSSIGDDEKKSKVQELEENGYSINYQFGFGDGINWAISRLASRKIVLPSEDEIEAYNHKLNPIWGSDDQKYQGIYNRMKCKDMYGWLLSEIKRLNGIN